MIRASQQRYESIMHQQEDRPQDPNHQNVISISSDENDTDYGACEDFEEENCSEEERSSYFKPSAGVEAFNAQCNALLRRFMRFNVLTDPILVSQIQTVSSTPATGAGSRARDPKIGGEGQRRTRKKFRGSTPFRKTSSGSRKPKSSTARASGGTSTFAYANQKARTTGSGGGRGIGMMPT